MKFLAFWTILGFLWSDRQVKRGAQKAKEAQQRISRKRRNGGEVIKDKEKFGIWNRACCKILDYQLMRYILALKIQVITKNN